MPKVGFTEIRRWGRTNSHSSFESLEELNNYLKDNRIRTCGLVTLTFFSDDWRTKCMFPNDSNKCSESDFFWLTEKVSYELRYLEVVRPKPDHLSLKE